MPDRNDLSINTHQFSAPRSQMICNVSRSLPNTLVPFAGDLERFTIAPEHDGSVQVGAVEEDVPLLQKADNLSMRMTVGIVLAKLRDRYLRIDRIFPDWRCCFRGAPA